MVTFVTPVGTVEGKTMLDESGRLGVQGAGAVPLVPFRFVFGVLSGSSHAVSNHISDAGKQLV